jgi:hypothetical protein
VCWAPHAAPLQRRSIEEKKKSRVCREDALLAQGIDLFGPGESSKNLKDHLALLRLAASIELEGEPIRSHRPLTGFAIKWVKQASRLLIRKYTDVLFARQNHFNAEVIAALSEMSRRLDEQKAENQRLRERLEALEPR